MECTIEKSRLVADVDTLLTDPDTLHIMIDDDFGRSARHEVVRFQTASPKVGEFPDEFMTSDSECDKDNSMSLIGKLAFSFGVLLLPRFLA